MFILEQTEAYLGMMERAIVNYKCFKTIKITNILMVKLTSCQFFQNCSGFKFFIFLNNKVIK